MSSINNNPITNAIDFISHGQKQTAIGNIEHPFDSSQVVDADDKNLALTGFNIQSDMLTSAYFNAEVGDLRETLAAYQIKTEINGLGDCKRRAVFVGGKNCRNGNYSIDVDINVGNYPLDAGKEILDSTGTGTGFYATNTGHEATNGQAIPNMELKGNTFTGNAAGEFPIFPISREYQTKQWPDSVVLGSSLDPYKNASSILDIRDILCTLFGLETLNMGINLDSDSVLGDRPLIAGAVYNNELPHNVYVSLTSAVTQWVRVCSIKITLGDIKLMKLAVGENHSGVAQDLKLSDGTTDAPAIEYCTSFKVELVIDGQYCPRQMIGNGMSHQQLFIWTECKMGRDIDSQTLVNTNYQFTFSSYLVNKFIDPVTKSEKPRQNLNVTKDATNKKIINIANPFDSTTAKSGDYLLVENGASTCPYVYKLAQDSEAIADDLNKVTLSEDFKLPDGKYDLLIVKEDELNTCGFKRFNIDEIRDRYSMFQLISHIGQIYRTSTGLSLPIKLVEYMSQVKGQVSLSNILYYISLSEMYALGNTSTIDAGKRLNQIFEFVRQDTHYYSDLEGANYGIALRYWNDAKDSVETGQDARFSCLNANDTIIDPADGSSHTYKSRNTIRVNKVKHVVITNLPGFKNGRYGTSMSSSNLIHGFFGSLSIDLSFSDTHTPVDVNGMTVHQWDINNMSGSDLVGGQNNPARWNVNADEEYRKLLSSASVNC